MTRHDYMLADNEMNCSLHVHAALKQYVHMHLILYLLLVHLHLYSVNRSSPVSCLTYHTDICTILVISRSHCTFMT